MNSGASAATESFWRPTGLVSTLLSRSAREVIWHWISQKQFLGEDNQPRSLAIGVCEEAGFNSLVTQVNQEFSPSVICNELLRKGIVEQDGSDCLFLRRSAYMPGRPAHAGTATKPWKSPMVSPNDQPRRIVKKLSVCSAT